MSARTIAIEVIAVLAGAIIGILVDDILSWLFAGESFALLTSSLSRYILALITVAIFAVLYAKLPPTPAALASFFVGVFLPTIMEKVAFGDVASWPMILFLNIVFALVALLTYRLVHANGAVRKVASDVSDDL